MKILCVSDEVDPLVYSVNLSTRCKNKFDLVISSGDLNLEYYEYIISSLNTDLFFVFGNHNLKYYYLFHKKREINDYEKKEKEKNKKWLYVGKSLEDKIIYYKKSDLILMGLGGSYRYNNGEHQYTDTQMKFRIIRKIPRLLFNKLFYGRYVDILVTHAPPFNCHDGKDLCHKGFDSFNWFIKKFKPKYFLHGHVHLIDLNKRPITRIGDTTVINVFKSYELEIGENKC